ncbi:M14 family zinc carboxypeptidase [Natronococcus sp. A-GB7]|uniref:M14 family zinc carboxypeptidase n=1 Tax=Natronococcus sp. A-GB7 TaxID=3037649 RepID=UPI00241F9C9B|nr:M14 family zinc carboxypeptidase [Natronococcus sp. A-GB7]MDG5818422.1 M14 family zinc carboxypeptidase [Natronococcus sp. A-GB7]
MQRRTALKSIAATATGLAFAGTASGDDDNYRPRGPWGTTDDQEKLPYASYYTNEQLADRLQGLDRRSDRLELRQIGESAGREDPIWEVQIGDGDESLHMINGIHGDEPSGLEATVQVLQTLAMGNSPEVADILDELSLTIIPDMNPDGNEFRGDDGLAEGNSSDFYQRRANTTEWDGETAEMPSYYYDHWDVPGYDLNRDFPVIPDFDPDEDENLGIWDGRSYGIPIDEIDLESQVDDPPEVIWGSGLNLNPETRATIDSFLEADPDWAFTHHHQGTPIDPDSSDENGPDWQTSMSVMAPQGAAYGDVSDDIDGPEDGNVFITEDAEKRSLQSAVLAKDAAGLAGGGRIDKVNRFPYGPLWGSYEEVLPLYTDAAALLYEVSHQSEERGQKGEGFKVKLTRDVYLETFRRIADGSIHDIDEMRYFDEMSVPTENAENPHTQ